MIVVKAWSNGLPNGNRISPLQAARAISLRYCGRISHGDETVKTADRLSLELFFVATFRSDRGGILQKTEFSFALLEPFTGFPAALVSVPVSRVARIQGARDDGFFDHWPAST